MDTRFELERISLHLLLNCNLKCKNCCVQAPYYKKKYHPTLRLIKAEIDRLFQIAGTIRFFAVEGGEPFLRKDLGEILGHLTQYLDQVGVEIPVITNGTIIPDNAVLDAAKALGNKIHFIVDNYGSLSCHVDEITDLFEKNNIRYTVRNYDDDCYYGGWVDFYGNYEKKRDRKGAESLHQHCAWVQKLKGVLEIVGDKIYFCPASRVFYERGLVVAEDEVIDFLNDQPVEVIQEKLQNLFEKPCLGACQYCNGIHNDSVRYRPAVQLTDDELKNVYLSPYLYREDL